MEKLDCAFVVKISKTQKETLEQSIPNKVYRYSNEELKEIIDDYLELNREYYMDYKFLCD